VKGFVFGLVLSAALALAPVLALAQGAYVFPNKGQSPQQQATDQAACQTWAQQQTGYNPMAPPPPPPAEAQRGGLVRGAARGAAVGAAVGAIAGDAGKGAAMGAAGGGLMGGMRRADQRREQDAAAQNAQAQQQQANANYMRAFAACMEGKGYTVK
jgi:hypothetical protein